MKNLFKLSSFLFKKGYLKEVRYLSDLSTNYLIDKTNDKGKKPWVVNIEDLTKDNENFRETKWTGDFFQMTIMSLLPKEDIGLEKHHDVDQFLRIESGSVLVQMGSDKDNLDFEEEASEDFAIFIPSGMWHNITNIGNEEAKLYSIYAKPAHEKGTIHKTKDDSEKEHSD